MQDSYRFLDPKVKTFSKTIIYFSRLKVIKCDLSHKNVPYERMQGMRTNGKRMDERWIAKPFAMERPNRWTDDENFGTDEVAEKDKRMKKIFERMRSNGWTAEEKFWATGCDVLIISRFHELEQIHGVRYVFSAFLRSRKSFASSRKTIMQKLTLNFHMFHRTDSDGFLVFFC